MNENEKKIAIWGSGDYGKMAIRYFLSKNVKIECIVDNDKNKWGTKVNGIEIVSPGIFLEMQDIHLYIAVNVSIIKDIETQCDEMGIKNYEAFDFRLYSERERLISYSSKRDMEDVVLYHALKDANEIFYIDVGSNDPYERNVTKLLYDMKNAHGINIDPQRGYIDMTNRERPRDINICCALSDEDGELELYYQSGYSTVVQENVKDEDCYHEKVKVTTLKKICEKYCEGKEIHVLKIDAEGSEAKILAGADFKRYKPWIVVVEATNPGTMEDSSEKWEKVLFDNTYEFARKIGVNKFYVLKEKKDLIREILAVDSLKEKYCIYHAELFFE